MKQFPEKMVKITARNLPNKGGDDREGGGRDLSIKRQNPGVVAIIISRHKFQISQFEDHNNSGGFGLEKHMKMHIVRNCLTQSALKKRKTDKVGMWNWSSSAARGDDLNDWGRVEPLPV